jgi:hypothetical protein
MYRFMKHMPTNTIHSYEPTWLRGDNHGFVECDAQGSVLNIIEGTATEVPEEAPKAKSSKKKATEVAVDSPAVGLNFDLFAPETAEEALSADATRGL